MSQTTPRWLRNRRRGREAPGWAGPPSTECPPSDPKMWSGPWRPSSGSWTCCPGPVPTPVSNVPQLPPWNWFFFSGPHMGSWGDSTLWKVWVPKFWGQEVSLADGPIQEITSWSPRTESCQASHYPGRGVARNARRDCPKPGK